MRSLEDMLRAQLSDRDLDALGNAIGTDKQNAKQAVDVALPELLKRLQKNARSTPGRESLERAIERDHDGTILDNVEAQMRNPEQGDGGKILEHMFGGERGAVEQQLGALSGIGKGGMAKVLIALAPIVLGMIGKAKKGGGGGLTDILGGLGGGKAGCLGMILPLLGKFLKR